MSEIKTYWIKINLFIVLFKSKVKKKNKQFKKISQLYKLKILLYMRTKIIFPQPVVY